MDGGGGLVGCLLSLLRLLLLSYLLRSSGVDFADDAEGGAEAAGGECACVAVREDVLYGSDGVGAVGSHFFVHVDVFVPDVESFAE